MEELDKKLGEMILKLKSAGIPLSDNISPEIKINSRAKKRLGCCIFKDSVNYIEVSAVFMDKEHSDLLEETIAHELLHTCKGCKNHGERWKYYASVLNSTYGYNIKRTVDFKDKAITQPPVNYIIVCQSCGIQISRAKMSKLVKYPHRYRCKCGGRLKRIM